MKQNNDNDNFDALKQKLLCGAFHGLPTNKEGVVELGENPLETILKTGGTTLTREECRTLWRILTGRLKFLPRGRKPADEQDRSIAWLAAVYVAADKQVKAAAGKAADLYGVKRSRFYAAIKKYPKYRQIAKNFDPARLQEMITVYESLKFPLKSWTEIP